jgi:dipeptidyl-peptidase-4
MIRSLILLALAPAVAQAAPDPGFLRQYALTRGFSLGRPDSMLPTPDGKKVLFLRAPPREPVLSLYEFDVATGESRELLKPAQLLKGAEEKLPPAERARRERMRVSVGGFTSYQLSDDGALVLLSLSGHLYTLTRSDGSVRELNTGATPAIAPRLSPDGTKVAYLHDRDLYVLDLGTGARSGKERRLTHSADMAITNGLAEFVAAEEMDRLSGFWWSGDSKWLAYEEADARAVERLDIGDVAHPEQAAEPAYYPRPGKANVKVRLGIVPASGGKATWVTWDDARFSYLAAVNWKDRAPLTLVVQTRDQKRVRVLAADRMTGKTRLLVEETDERWVNLDPTVPRWLPDGSQFLWSSEASGSWRLSLRDRDGNKLRDLSAAVDGYYALDDVDPVKRVAYFSGAPNPTEAQIYRVRLDGGTAERQTSEPGVHEASFGRDHRVWVERFGAPEAMPVERVHVAGAQQGGADRIVGDLPSTAERPPFSAKQELVQIGPLAFYAAIVRPRGFDPKRRYPVIDDVYGGPRSQQVLASQAHSLFRQWMADHGAIVVAIDGRGTPHRDHDWERHIAGDFSLTLEDQVDGLRALAARYPEIDLRHVGITGWSFGGYLSALAVLKRPEVFQVAVAGAPVVDWRDYDTHYTERYLGMPEDNRAGYEASSLITYAPKLSRPLLIVHGTSDDNVYFFHTLKLVETLFRAGRPFELLPLPGLTHMTPDPVVTEQLWTRIMNKLMATLTP